MLERLKVVNFQCHKQEVIEFEQITTFTGPSDRGKTALLRALRWACQNQPSGEAFLRSGADYVLARLDFDKHSICRRKGDGNSYTLNEQEYKAFGAGKVPDPVASALNVGDINFQMQLDGPFWFSCTPGEVSRQLNSIVNLEIIDRSLTFVASELAHARASSKIAEERLQTAQEQRTATVWALDAHNQLTEVERAETAWVQTRQDRTGLAQTLAGVQTATDALRKAEKGRNSLENVIAAGLDALNTTTKTAGLRKLLNECIQLQRTAQRNAPQITPLGTAVAQLQDVGAQRRRLQTMLNEIKQLQEQQCQHDEKANTLSKKLSRELGERCPLCGKS